MQTLLGTTVENQGVTLPCSMKCVTHQAVKHECRLGYGGEGPVPAACRLVDTKQVDIILTPEQRDQQNA